MWINMFVVKLLDFIAWEYVDKYVVVELLNFKGWEYVDKYVCGRTIELYRIRICG